MILKPKEFRLRRSGRAERLGLAGIGAILMAGGVLYALSAGSLPRRPPLIITAATARESVQSALTSDSEPSADPIPIEVDATRTGPPEEKRLKETLEAISRLAGPVPVTPDDRRSGEAAESGESASDWQLWGRLQNEAVPVTLPVASSEAVSVYAVHSREGATVALCNHTRQKTPTLLRIRLPQGVYKIERLSFSPAIRVAAQEDFDSRRQTQCMPEGTVARLDRLEGGDLANPGIVEKPIWLTPDQVCLIRYTDVAYAARAAFYQAREQLKMIHASAPTTAGRLSSIFSAGEPYIGGLTAGGRSSLEKRLGCIHRLLLLTAQAHSMHHNLQERKNVGAEAGAALMGSIERLNDDLAETGATLLGLVPQIGLARDSMPAAQQPENGSAPASALAGGQESQAAAQSATVTIALANTGARSVDLVKIGLDVSALPQNVRCEPGDPAMFGSLRPGQTARATFRLRWPADAALTDRQCVGDVSYFVANAPAHLRLRPW